MSRLKRCPECGASVSGENVERHLKKVHGGARSETDRRRQSRSSARERNLRNESGSARKRRRGLLLLLSTGIAIVAVIGLLFVAPSVDRSGEPSGPPDPAAACVQHTSAGIHWHVVLRITIAGADQKVPGGIGISPGCMSPLHTHAADGVIHIEYSGPVTFTLGQFFDVWGESFDENSLLWHKGPVRMTIGGMPTSTYRSQHLTNGLQIGLSAG